ncbi:MAG: hypothetical protein K6F68_08205 [Clostridiales bacterium]|nr:hypothetical protein [Clostridiales bacterium]
MDNTNGADKLITGILEAAQAEAQAIEADAASEVAAIKERLHDDKERLKDEFAKKAAAEREDLIKRAAVNAELDGRRETLKRKHALIDRAYSVAAEKLSALDGAEREAFLMKLLKKECSGFETVHPAERDEKAIGALLPACGIQGLKLGEAASGLDGGFILEGENYVKDCSFKAFMNEIKAETLNKAAAVLFD